jgi:hypothetical protein
MLPRNGQAGIPSGSPEIWVSHFEKKARAHYLRKRPTNTTPHQPYGGGEAADYW